MSCLLRLSSVLAVRVDRLAVGGADHLKMVIVSCFKVCFFLVGKKDHRHENRFYLRIFVFIIFIQKYFMFAPCIVYKVKYCYLV